MFKQQINEIYVEEFNDGKSFWEIAEKYDITYKNAYEAVTGHRFEARLLDDNEKNKIVEMYKSGVPTTKIGKMYGTGHKPMAAVLEEFGISRNRELNTRKYDIDKSYFDKIDSPNKAYILGFLAADGSNCKSKGTVSISLEECDKEILEKIRLEMKNERPLEFIDYSNKHDFGYTYKNQYRMLIFSKHICEMVEKWGIIKNKSEFLEFPDFIPDELMSHYIRGVFDGDGTLGCKNVETYLKRKTICAYITSTYNFCLGLQKYLNEILGIETEVKEASNKKQITYNIRIKGAESKKKFLDWMYQDAELFLKRKNDIYLEHYKLNKDSLTA